MKKIRILGLLLSSFVLFSCASYPETEGIPHVVVEPEHPGIEDKIPSSPSENTEKTPSVEDEHGKPEEPEVEEKEPLSYIRVDKELYMKLTGNLRKGPGIEYEILRVIYEDEKIEATAKVSNGWYNVQYHGEEGYLSGILLTSKKPEVKGRVPEEEIQEPAETGDQEKPDEPQEGEENQEPEAEELPGEKPTEENGSAAGGEEPPVTAVKPLADNEVVLPDATLKHQREVRHLGLKVLAVEVQDDTHPYGTILEMVSKPGIYKKGDTIEIKIAVASDKKAYFSQVDRSLQVNYKSVKHKDLEEEIFLLLNAYRKEKGLKELQKKEDLKESARYKSESMLQQDYFAHHNPHLEYISFGDLMNYVFKYTHYSKKGENLFANMGSEAVTAKVIFEGWKNSPSHNEAMLDPEYRYVGIGIITAPVSGPFYGGKYVTLATQHFGK